MKTTVRKIMLLQIIVVAVIGTGWIKNIIKLSGCDFEAPYKAEIVHGIGLLPPVCMVTGWIDIGK